MVVGDFHPVERYLIPENAGRVLQKIMIVLPVINSGLEKLFGQKSVNLNLEYPSASALNDASTR
jgi:hypothetical protein